MFMLDVEKRGSDAAVVAGLPEHLGRSSGFVFVQPHHQRKTSKVYSFGVTRNIGTSCSRSDLSFSFESHSSYYVMVNK